MNHQRRQDKTRPGTEKNGKGSNGKQRKGRRVLPFSTEGGSSVTCFQLSLPKHALYARQARPFGTAFAPSRKDFVQFFSKDDTNTTLPLLVSAAPGPFQPAT